MSTNSNIVFTAAARRAQAERGSARGYDKRVAAGFPDHVTRELAAFIADLDAAFIATVSAEGAPYIQHRGGPKGFIKLLDDKTLGFADYAGNRQYITLGNLADPEQVILFTVSTWDANCPQHIPQRFEAADVAAATRRARQTERLEADEVG